ncbi:50S ribosomal protein L20 [bacterium]|nr:50S ribosomal protein L20 [bacterium]MBU1636889.1 50S ribosomal protein L20 [bacterium]RQV98652.1 MAG: 50S ribosomal protein L20 [bacterium]
MPRSTNNPATRKRRNKVFKAAKGYRGSRGNLIRVATETVEKGWNRAFIDRRRKKREYRSLWIVRINAAVRQHGMTYSGFMSGLKAKGIELDRRQLADLAVHDPAGFAELTQLVAAA